MPQQTIAMKLRSILLTSGMSLLIACQTVNQQAVLNPNQDDREVLPGDAVSSVTTTVNAAIEPEPLSETPVVYDDLWERLRAGFKLADSYDHPEVTSRIDNYAENQRFFDLVGERASPFLFRIVEEIEKRGLPLELALLPIVESTFDPNAYSRQHAVGLWQFVAATGKSFGLQQDWWYDGRRDPEAATIAALEYLTVLNQQFNGDWLLTMAAYNTGDGNLRRAIRRAGQTIETTDFWSLPLASETRSHVPRILALAKIISDPAAFDVALQPIANEAFLVNVDIGAQIDLTRAAQLADLDYEQLKALNPGYRQWATHPDFPQVLAVPKSNASLLLANLEGVNRKQLVTWDRYQIRSGDTLGGIARRLNTSVDILQTVNRLRGSRIIAGDSLLIPRSGDLSDSGSSPLLAAATRTSNPVPDSYTVRPGDNLWRIARRYQIKSAEIALWNDIELDALLQPGQVLNLQFASTGSQLTNNSNPAERQRYYRVQAGDSMAKIADLFDTQLLQLLNWNGISAREIIYPGQQIRISPPEPGFD